LLTIGVQKAELSFETSESLGVNTFFSCQRLRTVEAGSTRDRGGEVSDEVLKSSEEFLEREW
jgi:hypothetical protein